ncbi:MAG: CHAT domain-containing protein [Deferribacteres bacterium]|nr:CHAT domain-containing protein [Deferribacteres bacterium]
MHTEIGFSQSITTADSLLRQKNQQYSALCLSFAEKDVRYRTRALMEFIEINPDYYRAYQRLRDELFWHNEKEQAYTIFTQLSQNPETSAGGFWLRAQLALIDGDSVQATDFYIRAMKQHLHFFPFILDLGKVYHNSEKLRSQVQTDSIKKYIPEFYSSFNAELALLDQDFPRLDSTINSMELKKEKNQYIIFFRSMQFWQIGEYEKSIKQVLAQLKNAELIEDKTWEAGIYFDLISLAISAHKYEYASKLIHDAKLLANSLNDATLSGRIEIIAGDYNNYYLGNYKKTIDSLETILPHLQTTTDHQLRFQAYRNIGYAYHYSGDHTFALKFFLEAEKQSYALPSQYTDIYQQFPKAHVYKKLKQTTIAKEIFTGILQTIKSNDPYVPYCLSELGDLSLDEQNYKRAQYYYNRVLSEYPNHSNAFGRLGRCLYLEKKYREAAEVYQKALSQTDEKDRFYYWYTLRQGEVALELRQLTQAKNAINNALDYGLKSNKKELLWEVYFALGRLHVAEHQTDAAIQVFQKAVDIIEFNRNKLNIDQFRIGYFAEGSVVYEHLAEAYFQRYRNQHQAIDLDSVFFYTSLTRGRAIREAMEDREKQTRSLEESKEAAPFRELRQKIATTHYRMRLSILDTVALSDSIYNTLETDRMELLAQKLRALESMPGKDSTETTKPGEFIAIDSLQTVLTNRGAALLQYHISNRQSFVTAIHPDTVVTVPLEITADSLDLAMDHLLNPFYRITGSTINTLEFRADIAFMLYRKLLQPVSLQIKLPLALIIDVDNHLAGLPFSILLNREPNSPTYTIEDSIDCAANFLLLTYTFSYSPSISTLLRAYHELKGKDDILILADPATQMRSELQQFKSNFRYQMSRDWFFQPLPSALEEASAMQNLGLSTEVLLQSAATESALLQHYQDYRILHFATHAFIDTVFDAFSGVVLALDSDTTSDGLLMGFEFEDMNLNHDLITLGACESGHGRKALGEGIIGLPRTILTAGAHAVLQTLWKIDDEFSGKLLPVFYDNYFNHNMNKAEALTAAKRSALQGENKYRHPFFWAAYTLYGDSRRNVPGWFERNRTALLVTSLILLSLLLLYSGLKGRRTTRQPKH